MYMASEENMWPTESGWFDTLDEAKEWAKSNLKGDWKIWKKGFFNHEEVYSNH